MSQRRLERLLNLTMCLMATPRFLTGSEIGGMVEGYDTGGAGPEHDAFRRMFERDKQYLRDLGIPLEMGTNPNSDEVGYRIRRDDYALPDILLGPDEAAALALAARLWSTTSLAAPAASALRKLAAGSGQVAPPGLGGAARGGPAPGDLLGFDGPEPRVDAADPAFAPCLAAVQAGQAVRFPYRKPGEPEAAERHVEPWGVLSWRGRWYLAGFDRRREAPRVFRLSRVAGPVRPAGAAGAVAVPEGVDLRSMVTRSPSSRPDAWRSATVAARVGAGHALRRRARPADGPTPRGVGTDFDVLSVRFSDLDRMARWLAGYGADVVVLGPQDLRAEVVRRLRAVEDASAACLAAGPLDPVPLPPPPRRAQEPGPAPRRRSARDGAQPPAEDRLPRLLALVPWLRARPGVSVDEAARAFGITARQLVDDLDLLFVCGLPGGSPGDLIDLSYEGGRITVADPQTLDRPLRLTVDEATALVVAARALADLPRVAGREALQRAVARVEEAIGSRPAARVQVRLDPPDEVLTVLQRALRERRRVHLRYLVWSRDELTERDVDPMRLFSADGHWYLEGFCHRAGDVRVFRVDSVDGGADGVTVLDVLAAPPAGAAARDLSGGVFSAGPGDVLAVLDVSAGARWAADHYPVESVAELPDGGLRLTLYAAGTAWLRRLVLGLGGEARVAGPAGLVSEIHGAAAKALAAYAPLSAGR